MLFQILKVELSSGELVDPQHCEGEGNILAHIPSVRPDARSSKTDDLPVSDDEVVKPIINEETLSK